VAEAVDARGRRVAVKELHASLVALPNVRSRFAATASMLTAIDHPHVVRVMDAFDADGRCVLGSEFLDGGTLRQRSARGVSPEVACAVVLAVASGIERANRAGVLHRDLKPENVLFTSTGVAKVSDFGLAEIVSGPRTVATRDGTVLGAPDYMPPELVRSEQPCPASDVYALATMLYELLAGRLPFVADGDPLATMARHVQEAPADLMAVAHGVAPSIAGVTMHGLAPEPDDRYAAADEFGAALADAAAQAWGPGWLRQTGITVTASEVITDRLRATRALEAPVVADTLAPRVDPNETVTAPVVATVSDAPVPVSVLPPSRSSSSRRGGLIAAAVVAVIVVGAGLLFLLTRSSGGPTTIGPKSVNVPGTATWTDTGIDLHEGDDVSVTASGTVFPGLPDRSIAATPDGVPNRPEFRSANVVAGVDHSGLIGRVGATGQPFVVGHDDRFTAAAGRLFLGINDVGVENNDGSFSASVTVTRK